MSKKYDSYGVREEEVIYLAQPGKKAVCALGGVDRTTVSLEDKLNDISELTFEIDKYYNGEPVQEYDWVDQHMLLYVDGIWFKIKEQPIIKTEDLREYKEVTAMSLETELQQYLLVGFKVNQGTVDSIEKIYQDEHELDSFQQVRFYNKDIPELSLVDAILAYANVPDWKIGYVDDITIGTEADLNGEYKTLPYEVAGFDVESQDVYSFLTQDVSKTFSCMFQFDTENKLINAYRVDAVGYDTNIILGFRNLQNSLEVSCDTEMYTAFEVRGNEDMTIDYVNFNTSQIEDISYFLNTKYMSQELIDKYNAWIEYRESRRPEYIELSGEYNTLLNTISEITYRVPTDGVENDWTTYEEDDLTLALDNYNAMVTQLEHLYVDDHGNFDLEALKASTDWELYKQIVDYIIPSIKAALQKQGVDTSTNGVGNMFTNVNPIITIGWQTTTEDILTPIDITDKPCNGVTRGIQIQSNGGFYQEVNGLIVGDTYTISVYVKCESNGIINIGNSTSIQDDIDIIGSFDVTNEWVRVNVSFVALEKYYQCYFTFGEGNYVVCGMQLERGTLHDFGYFAGLGNETDILSAWETDWNLYGTIELKNKLDSYKNVVEALKENGFDSPYLEGGDYSWEYHTKMYQKYMDYYSLIDDCQKAYDERCAELKVQEDKCDEITEQRQQIVNSVQKENFGSVQETYDGFTDEELSLLRTFINQTDYVNENITLTTLDTEKEKVNQQYDLYLKAKEQLYIESHPQYIYSDTVDNLYALPEFKEYHEDLKVGNFLWIEDSEEHFVKLRVVTIKYNPCTWDNDITIEFSNMVQGQSKRDDIPYIIQSAIESTRNQIIGATNNNDITTYTITSEFIRQLLQNPIMNNAISTGSSNAVSSVTGQIDYLVSKTIKTEKVTADVVDAVTGNFQKIFTTYIEGDLASFNKTVTDFLMAGQIITDDVKSATGAFTNYLTGVRILGDLIEANTIIADKIVLRGSNESVVYQLNQLGELTTEMVENIEQYQFDAGKVIIADSITSREINVNDLWVTGIANMLNANIGNALINDLTALTSHLGNWYFHESIIEGDYGSMLIGGYLQSKNYTENNGAVTAGCKIDLNNFSIDSPNFKISLSGNVEMTGTLTVGSKVSMGSVYDENGTPLEDVLNTIGTSINLHSKDGQVFTESASVITPDSITVNAVCDGDVTVAKWLIDDVENTEYVAADKMSITIPSSYMASKKQIIVKAQNADGTVYDYITLCRLADGTNGTNGENGIGYTIALSNENHGFVADGDGIVQDEQIQIKASAWKNISAIATTVTIPELPTGMTATVSNNGTTNTYITIKVDNTLTDTQGTVEFGVTADSVNFVKAFSWSVNRGGKDGKPGTVYGIDSSSTSAVYNIRNSECTPSSGSFNAYYSEGDSKEKLPLDCYMQISYTSTGSTWIKYGDRLHCTNGTTAFNFLSTSHLDGLPVNTETGIITAVKCEIFATETSDTAYASKEITIVPSMNELAVLGFVEENNTIYVDGSNFYAGSIHTSALAAEVIKSIGCEYSSNSVYTTKGTYFDLATGVLASKNFAIDESGNAFFKGEITATSGKLGNWNIGDSSIYYAGDTTYTNDESAFNNSGSMYFGTSGLSLGKKFVYDKSTDTLTVTGNIVANSLTLGSGVTIDADDISGLSSEVSYYVGQSGAIIKGTPVGSATASASTTSFKVSSSGLLEASNAVIYGTIYASAGEFTGEVNAKTMTAKQYYKIYYTDSSDQATCIWTSSTWTSNQKLLNIGTYNQSYFTFNTATDTIKVTGLLKFGDTSSYINVSSSNGISIRNKKFSYTSTVQSSGYTDVNEFSIYGKAVALEGHIHNALKSASNDYRVKITSNGNFKPSKVLDELGNDDNDNVSSCGTSGSRWTAIYAAKGTIQTSDKNEKENINDIDERYEKMFMQLRPVTYRWKNIYSHENHDRLHCGLIAQEVYEALINNGLSMETFAVVGKDDLNTPTPDGRTERWNMNYSELHGLEIHMIQKMFKEIEELKETINELKESCLK